MSMTLITVASRNPSREQSLPFCFPPSLPNSFLPVLSFFFSFLLSSLCRALSAAKRPLKSS